MRHIFSFIVLTSMLLAGCAGPGRQSPDIDLIITNARLYVQPAAAPLDNARLAIADGVIVAIGKDADAAGQGGATVIDAGGRAVTAGLWNSHIHLMDASLKTAPQNEINNILLRYGFTSALDTGSDLAATLAIRKGIENGELKGPRIYMANGTFVYTDGTPAYLPGIQLPEIDSAEKAAVMVAEVLDAGAEGIKIFGGSFMSPTKTIHMPPEIIRAVAKATHDRGGFLVSHPNDQLGLVNSVENGVDILAHTTPRAEPLSEELIAKMLANNIAMIPTLKLWSYELRKGNTPEPVIRMVEQLAVKHLADYFSAGGEILFGTDVGYMRDADPAAEYSLMQKAGMDFASILRSLTASPAARFAGESGAIEKGGSADLVIYQRDPASDVTAFAEVQYTIRSGQFVYCADATQPQSPCAAQ